ncbi:hypothetical protein EDB85DRAFT_111259 [Lactarius pseudohatsudake]|nr:hypothetical protein EDB85DRAFT_111259 [Lactarius pseudohatsudake]
MLTVRFVYILNNTKGSMPQRFSGLPPPLLSTLQHWLEIYSRRPENIMVSENVFHKRGITLLYRTFNLIIQSVLYGIYASLVPVSTYIMMKKGLRSLSQKILFGVIVFMFSLSTAYLAVSIADLIILIKTWYLYVGLSESAGIDSPTETLLVLFNALAPINYALTDGVVVWRAWVICRDEYRKLLRALIVMLVLTMFTVAATIGVRVFINANPVRDKNPLATTINVFQETALISSLVTNIFGTGVISFKAWRYRRWIATDLQRVVNKRTKAERVLALLVESGVFYIFLAQCWSRRLSYVSLDPTLCSGIYTRKQLFTWQECTQ